MTEVLLNTYKWVLTKTVCLNVKELNERSDPTLEELLIRRRMSGGRGVRKTVTNCTLPVQFVQ